MEPYTRRDFFFALVSPHTTLTHVAWMEIMYFVKYQNLRKCYLKTNNIKKEKFEEMLILNFVEL